MAKWSEINKQEENDLVCTVVLQCNSATLRCSSTV